MINNLKKSLSSWRSLLITVSSITFLITVLRLSGLLQPLSWLGYDLLFKFRPQEPPDPRIVIVSLIESDIQKYQQWPVSDLLLSQLLKKIKAQQPVAIGLDFYRDLRVPPGHEELVKVFETTPNLIGVKKSGAKFYPSVPASPVLEQLGQVSASDVILDHDGVLRRAILFPRDEEDPALPSLGLAVALEYLQQQEIYPEPSSDGGWMKLADTVFYPLKENSGGYVDIGIAEYQIMLNFRGATGSFSQVSFAEVLEGNIEKDLFTNKIVLIGSGAISLKDFFYTPYSKGTGSTPKLTYGVEVQANLASQIISTVLDGRPLIKTWSELGENLWIFLWILLPAIWVWKWRKHENVIQLLGIIISGTIGLSVILIISVYLSFLQGWWLPSVIPLLSLWISSIAISRAIYIEQIIESKKNLEIKVEQRTQQLKSAQEQILAQERLAYLGFLSAGVIHEIKNPVSIIDNFSNLLGLIEKELRTIHQDYLDIYTEEDRNTIDNKLFKISKYTKGISEQLLRIQFLLNNLLPNIVNKKKSGIEKININKLLNNVNLLVYYSKQPEELPTGLKLENDYDNSLQEINVVVTQLTQVLVNLIDNAYDSLREKQQQLQDENYVPLIRLSSRDLPKAIEISIFDNGIGIAEELKNKIFQPFFTTKVGKGTGLGLSLVRDFIVANGGKITVESELDNYAKFTIILPK